MEQLNKNVHIKKSSISDYFHDTLSMFKVSFVVSLCGCISEHDLTLTSNRLKNLLLNLCIEIYISRRQRAEKLSA